MELTWRSLLMSWEVTPMHYLVAAAYHTSVLKVRHQLSIWCSSWISIWRYLQMQSLRNITGWRLMWIFSSIFTVKRLLNPSATSPIRCFINKRDRTKMRSLPSVCSTRLQVLLWRAADKNAPLTTNLSLSGWTRGENIPVLVQGSAETAPKSVLKLVACGCKSVTPSSRATRSCWSDTLPCTTYYWCKDGEQYVNVITKKSSIYNGDWWGNWWERTKKLILVTLCDLLWHYKWHSSELQVLCTFLII